VVETEVRPPEPLFLPIAEFETDLLDKPFPPFPPEELKAQQEQQDFDSSWVRPIVINNGQPVPEPGPAPQKKPLYLPIAEFDLDLLQNLIRRSRRKKSSSSRKRWTSITAGRARSSAEPAPRRLIPQRHTLQRPTST
jgi:hypothetical protein